MANFLFVQVVNKAIPTPQANQLLVVLPFSGIPTPQNYLPIGLYFSQANTTNALAGAYVWTNIMTLLQASILDLISKSISANSSQISITQNLNQGTNTITHGLGRTPRVIQFYQSNGVVIQFLPSLNSGNPLQNFTIFADKAYSDVTINIIAF